MKLSDLWAKKDELTPDAQQAVQTLLLASENLEKVETMKATDGWKLFEAKVKEELANHINLLIKDDPKIQTLIAVLNTVETKQTRATLEEQIKTMIPE